MNGSVARNVRLYARFVITRGRANATRGFLRMAFARGRARVGRGAAGADPRFRRAPAARRRELLRAGGIKHGRAGGLQLLVSRDWRLNFP